MTQEKTITIRINHNDKLKTTAVNVDYSSNGVTEAEMKAAVCALSENYFLAMLFFNEQQLEQDRMPIDKLIALVKRDLQAQTEKSIQEICVRKNLKIDKNAFSLENIINSSKSLH